MAKIEQTTRTVYRAPTKGRTYLSARSAAQAEANAMLGKKYPSEDAEYEESGRMTYPGYHWGNDDRLVRVHKPGSAHPARLAPRRLHRQQGAVMAHAAQHQAPAACWCATCRPVSFGDMRMVLCPVCGNKRCPHATDHRYACTGSNERGQAGSAYD